MSHSSDSLADRVERGSPSDAESAIYCNEEFSEQHSMTNSSDSEEVEQQSKVNPHDDNSGLDLPRLPAVTNAESLKETILELQTIVTEFDRADPHSCADVAYWNQQGCLNSDRSELGTPSKAAPPKAAAYEDEKRIPDHNNNDWKEWLITHEGDV